MPSARRGGLSSTSRDAVNALGGSVRSFVVVILLLLTITPRVAAFTMVSAARRKAPAAAVHKKTSAPAPVVVRKAVTSTPAQSNSSTSSGSSSSSNGGLVEKFGDPERPLRLILVGHNPSAAAWSAGHYYANPSNRMWRLLSGAGIIPVDFSAKDDGRCPAMYGIGFTDLGYGQPGTDSSMFKAQVLHSWRQSFYQRLLAHSERAGSSPKIVAFTGKRQFQELFFDSTLPMKGSVISYGLQTIRPEGFPFTAEETLLFVLTSSSGAAAMSNEAREAPYKELAVLLQQFPWEVPTPMTTDGGKS